MANVLFCANQIFTSKAPNFLSRRLFIVSDNDNPHGDSKSLRSAATVRAKDLYDLGVTIELFPISRPDHEFDTSKFYDVGRTLGFDRPVLIPLRISFTKPLPPIQRLLLICSPRRRFPQPPEMASPYSILFCPVLTPNPFLAVHYSQMSP